MTISSGDRFILTQDSSGRTCAVKVSSPANEGDRFILAQEAYGRACAVKVSSPENDGDRFVLAQEAYGRACAVNFYVPTVLEWSIDNTRNTINCTYTEIENTNFKTSYTGRLDSGKNSGSLSVEISGLDINTDYSVTMVLSTDESNVAPNNTINAVLGTIDLTANQADGINVTYEDTQTLRTDGSGNLYLYATATDPDSAGFPDHCLIVSISGEIVT